MTAMHDLLTVAVRHRLSRIELEVDLALGSETLALIGPSGAGKTSVLRALSGLLRPDWARIVLAGRTLVDTDARICLPPDRRNVGVMFQDGALFPHMTIARNVEYGLRPRPRSRAERREQVARLLGRFGIESLSDTRPDKASGGERQRVALARAVATTPDVLLLDEPLSALDPVTRAQVSLELAAWLAELRLPTILVSHDYDDVAGLADRIAVMDAGKIVQIGTADDLRRAPASAFVAAFVATNYFTGVARPAGAGTLVELAAGGTVLSTDAADGTVGIAVQPWEVALAESHPDGPARNTLRGPIVQIASVGNAVRVTVGSAPPIVAEITVDSAARLRLERGRPAVATWEAAATRLLPGRGASPRS